MKRRDSLDAVVTVTGERERNATREMVEHRRRLEEQERRLAELEEYRRHYLQRLQQAGGAGMGVSQLNEYRVFLSRLDQAVRQQHQLLESARAEFERCRSRWLVRRRERKAVDNLVARRREERLRRADAREQKELDELAGRRGKGRLA